MIPLAPGPGTLDPMSWAWLTATPVALITFIGTVIGIPASVITIWLVVHNTVSRPAETPAPKPELAPAAPDTRPVPAVLTAAPAERDAPGAFVPRAYRDIARKALAAGWRIQSVGHHAAWISPDGTRVLAPTTPRGGEASVRELMRRLRHAGLESAA